MTSVRTAPSQTGRPANLRELLRRVVVKATSPDGSVTATYTGGDGARVRIDERSLVCHGDTSLSEALTAAVRHAVNGARQAHDRLRGIRNGSPAHPPGAQARSRSGPGFNIKQYSPRHYVFVVIGRSGQVTIHLRPRAVSTLRDASVIEDEVNSALAQAHRHGERPPGVVSDIDMPRPDLAVDPSPL